jgi:hypothetical protein
MNIALTEKLSELLKVNKLTEAIGLAEDALLLEKKTDFHRIVGKNLLSLSGTLADYLESFYKSVKGRMKIKALYSEMNGFTINPDLWYLDSFAYDKFGGMDDFDWLADWEPDNTTPDIFVIKGYEELQEAYEKYMKEEKWKDDKESASHNICELLIVLRLQELFKEAAKIGRERKMDFVNVPLLVTAHDYYDLVYRAT